MLDIGNILQLIIDGFDYRLFSQEPFVFRFKQPVLHNAAPGV